MKLINLALALLLMTSCSQSAQLEIKDPWTRDTVGSTANAAVFMTIKSSTGDRLLSASTSVAKKTDLMTMGVGRNVMEMRYLTWIDLPAGKAVSLNSSGLHVWLAKLDQPLKAGQTFPLTLNFEKAGVRNVRVVIIEPAAPPPSSSL